MPAAHGYRHKFTTVITPPQQNTRRTGPPEHQDLNDRTRPETSQKPSRSRPTGDARGMERGVERPARKAQGRQRHPCTRLCHLRGL